MYLTYSKHWLLKRNYRPDITTEVIEYCLLISSKINDKHWADIMNGIARIPPSNRTLKVVYKIKGQSIKILTAYWLD